MDPALDAYEEKSETVCRHDLDRVVVRHRHHRYSRVDVSRCHHQGIRASGEISQNDVKRRPRGRKVSKPIADAISVGKIFFFVEAARNGFK
jgi:hypothetical protein